MRNCSCEFKGKTFQILTNNDQILILCLSYLITTVLQNSVGRGTLIYLFSTEKLPRLHLRCQQEWFLQLENQALFSYSTWTHNCGIQFWMLFSIWGLLVLNMWNSSGQFNQQTFMLALYTNGIRHEYLVVVADSSKIFWAVQ